MKLRSILFLGSALLTTGGMGFWLGSGWRRMEDPKKATSSAARPVVAAAAYAQHGNEPGQRTRGEMPGGPLPSDPAAPMAAAVPGPVEVLRDAAAQGDRSRQSAANVAARALVKTDPAAAATLTAALASTEIGMDPLEHVANDWAARDPLAAVAWGEAYSGLGKAGFLMRAWNGLLRSDLGADPARLRQAAAAFREWLAAPEEGDWDYAVHQLEESLRERYLTHLGFPETIGMLEGLYAGSSRDGRAAWKLLGGWLNKDSVAASAWVNSQQSGPTRDRYIFRVLQYASTVEPQSMEAWIGALSTPGQQEVARKAAQEGGKWPRFD